MTAPTQGMGTLGVADILLDGKSLSEDVSDAIVDIELTRTITGASTLKLTVADPKRTLLRSGIFATRVTLTLDGLSFTLVEVEKQQDLLFLTFEDTSVNKLRHTNGVIVAATGTTTRSQFAQRLVAQTPGVTIVAYPDPVKTREPISRGTSQNPLESTWACLTRLANEVQWRCFSDGNTIYFGPDDWLMQQTVIVTLREFGDDTTTGAQAVDNIDFDFDEGKPLTTITVTCPAALWVWPPGKPVKLEAMGVADGTFLTSQIARSLFVTTAQITLTAPQLALPEPSAVVSVSTGGKIVDDTARPSQKALLAVAAAKSQLGVTYVYGTEDPGKSFDCSGLTQWCYAQVGITLPRTSETQYAAGPKVTGGLRPGDLVFFVGDLVAGESPPGHVGIYIGGGQMIDAPYTGAVVRIDNVATVGSYMGATRPAG